MSRLDERVRRAFTPVAPPRLVSNLYCPEELEQLWSVVRERGPWSLIAAQTFTSAEEYLATAGPPGAQNAGLTLADLLTPTFRGYFARQAVSLYDEITDVFYDSKLLNLVKDMFGAPYAMPAQFFFNVRAPALSFDAGHVDPQAWRGLDMGGLPVWLSSVMAKSGLFRRWEIKTGQVITYFYTLPDDGGFTYWPTGPAGPPQRIPAPLWNDAVVVENPRMFHRGEASGPVEARPNPADLCLETVVAAAGGEWVLRNGDDVIARYPAAHMRFLFHYGARVFDDSEEVATYYDHSDDLTVQHALDLLIDDLRDGGMTFTPPQDPLHDREFISLLTKAYAVAPAKFPVEAPLDVVKV